MSASPFSLLSATAVSLVPLIGVFFVAEGQNSQEEPHGDLHGARKENNPQLTEGRPVLITTEESHKENQGGST